MNNFWIGVAAAQNAVAGTKKSGVPRRSILPIVAGIALGLLIGAALFIAAALTS